MGMQHGMMEIDSIDLERLAAAASSLAMHPGSPPESSVKEFLQAYPFPMLFSALSSGSENPEFVSNVVEALRKIFQSQYGSHLLPELLPYAAVGLSAESPVIRELACATVSKILENGDEGAVQSLGSSQLMGSLLRALADEDSTVAKAAGDAITNLAKTPAGLELLFTEKGSSPDSFLLKELASSDRALVRIRVLSVTARIFGQSEVAAAAVQNSGILAFLDREIRNSSDILAQVNALELICELADSDAGKNLLLAGSFLGEVVSLIKNTNATPLVRSRSILAGARLISISAASESCGREIVHAISTCLAHLEQLGSSEDKSVKEAGVTALGQIGSSAFGAEFILYGSDPVAVYVIRSALMGRGDSLHQAAIYAFALIAGSERSSPLLSEVAEASLRSIVFDTIRTPLSSKILSLLRQAPEIRQATYRLLVPLVSRAWCLWELSSSKDIMDLIVDPRTEISASKEAMEWRHSCCVALSTALSAAVQRGDTVPDETVEKLNTAVRRGPFLSREGAEAVPLVVAEERF